MGAKIESIGIYLPKNVIDNAFFEKTLDTSDEWIKTRTGIQQRFFADVYEFTSDISVKAAINLADEYHKELEDVDFIMVATSTPDQAMPSVASQVQTRLKIKNAGTMDVSAACAGFLYGIVLAKGLIAAKTHKKILVIGADTLSKVTDFTDRRTCILFGDGAGAVIVEASDTTNHLFHALTGTDGFYGKDLYISNQEAPISGLPVIPNNKIQQNGKAVFKWAVQTLIENIRRLAAANNITLKDVDLMIPHSANIRILEAVCNELGFPIEKCLHSITMYGNTSAASIPIAWYNGLKDGKVKIGDKFLAIGFGGGLTYAGIYMENGIKQVAS